MRRLLATAVVISAAVAAACAGGGQPASSPTTTPSANPSANPSATPTATPSGSLASGENIFQNPGFEDGRDPWFSLKPPDFVLSEDTPHAGEASALLEMRAAQQDEGAKVFYLVQEVVPTEFPEVISGHYRVTNWVRGTRFQYLQFAVIAFGANNLPGNFPNHQIRYILAGIDEEPFGIANAHFVFLTREDPPVDEWVPFQVDVGDDFRELWGDVPDYENIRVLFEVRYDGKVAGESPPEADVYYDDLYFGPAQ